MSKNTVNTVITGGVLGGLTVPTVGAVVTGALVAILVISIVKNAAKLAEK